MTDSGGRGYWGTEEARWYSEGLRYSDYADKVIGAIAPLLAGCSSLLDVGAGCGALSIPIARLVDHVLAIDPSVPMVEELQREADSRGITNVRTEVASWDDVESGLGDFDAALCANVPDVLGDLPGNVPRLERHASRLVFLILGTPKNANKFYLQELWPLVHKTAPPRKPDYFAAYGTLYDMGIFANVTLVDYAFDQPFRDLDEAVLFWKSHMRLHSGQWDQDIKDFLAPRLAPFGGLLWASIPKQSAIIWWRTDTTA